MITQGWQCPICKRVYSPQQKMCLYCGDNKLSNETDSSVNTVISSPPYNYDNSSNYNSIIEDFYAKYY